ncbi:MAG: ClbS/DfsB family four-helix bundle protein [Planctomycetota bacterium]
MKYATKRELIASIETEHATFLELAATVPQRRYAESGVWGDDWSIKDLFIHLTEWEQMLIGWYTHGRNGAAVELPAPGFKWNETPALNRELQRRTKSKSWRRARAEFDDSYDEVLALVKGIAPKKLFEPGHFAWTKKNPLVSYVSANTSGHYRTATKILKRWKRTQ